jgi:hypothetical protein
MSKGHSSSPFLMDVILAIRQIPYALHSVLDPKSEEEWGNLFAPKLDKPSLDANLLPLFSLQTSYRKSKKDLLTPKIKFLTNI